MVDHDPSEIPPPEPADRGARCPWCSAPIASPEDVTCRTCGATLRGDSAIEVPGVTAIDVLHVIKGGPARKVRGTLGSLFIGGDDAIGPPSEAELPALAMPDPEVRREILRLRLDAELADLTARADALAAERGILVGAEPGPRPEPDGSPLADPARGTERDEAAGADQAVADGSTKPDGDASP